MRGDVVAADAEESERFGRETVAVPQVSCAPGHPTDLRAPHTQPVVVELLAEPDLAASARVERQVDDGALGSQDSQRRCQCARLPAALEDYVGSTVAGSVVQPDRV